jgi:hypothetical protein
MGEMMMKIGATKPVMKDTMPILKGVLGARWEVGKRKSGTTVGPFIDDMYRKKNRGLI